MWQPGADCGAQWVPQAPATRCQLGSYCEEARSLQKRSACVRFRPGFATVISSQTGEPSASVAGLRRNKAHREGAASGRCCGRCDSRHRSHLRGSRHHLCCRGARCKQRCRQWRMCQQTQQCTSSCQCSCWARNRLATPVRVQQWLEGAALLSVALPARRPQGQYIKNVFCLQKTFTLCIIARQPSWWYRLKTSVCMPHSALPLSVHQS